MAQFMDKNVSPKKMKTWRRGVRGQRVKSLNLIGS